MRFRNYKKILSEQISGFSPESNWKKSSRGALLARIRQTKSWQEPKNVFSFGSIFGTMFASHLLKPILAGFLVFTTLMYSSVMTVQAAKASLPGDMIYPVKLKIENMRVSLVFSEERKAELEVGFASNRLKEVNQIIEQDFALDEIKENIKKAMQGFSDNLDSVQKRLEKIEKKPKSDQAEQKTLAISKLVNEKTQELEDNLLEIKEKIIKKDVKNDDDDNDAVEKMNKLAESKETDLENDNKVITSTVDVVEIEEVVEELYNNNDVATTTVEVATTTKDKILLDTEEESASLLETLDTALVAVDEANTKSLKVFVDKAATSDNEEVKQDAVDKLHKKIKKVQEDISADIEIISEENIVDGVDEEESKIEETPTQAKETIDQAKKILDKDSTEVISEVIEKIIQAKAIVDQEDDSLKESEIDVNIDLNDNKNDILGEIEDKDNDDNNNIINKENEVGVNNLNESDGNILDENE